MKRIVSYYGFFIVLSYINIYLASMINLRHRYVVSQSLDLYIVLNDDENGVIKHSFSLQEKLPKQNQSNKTYTNFTIIVSVIFYMFLYFLKLLYIMTVVVMIYNFKWESIKNLVCMMTLLTAIVLMSMLVEVSPRGYHQSSTQHFCVDMYYP